MIPLGLLSIGEKGQIVEVRHAGTRGLGGSSIQTNRVEEMGLRVGKEIEMISNGGGGPLLIKVDESRIALGRGVAMKVLVRRKTV